MNKEQYWWIADSGIEPTSDEIIYPDVLVWSKWSN
jgi:hypothetical protein